MDVLAIAYLHEGRDSISVYIYGYLTNVRVNMRTQVNAISRISGLGEGIINNIRLNYFYSFNPFLTMGLKYGITYRAAIGALLAVGLDSPTR